jgi:HEAT repeat protein
MTPPNVYGKRSFTQTPKIRMMDHGYPIQGRSSGPAGDGASQECTGRSSFDCGGKDGASTGTACLEPHRLILEESSACVRQPIDKLKSLHDGYRGVIEVVTCGNKAIPALRVLLLQREPSGLYQPRCLAVRAALEAYDVLVEYLNAPREIADPVERAGEDAVINAAACALAGLQEERIFALLLSLAETRLLPGVIVALDGFGKVEAIPYLVEALSEDESRPAAEAGLRNLGFPARQALLVAAAHCSPSVERESDSSLRRRRSALALLTEIGIRPETWPLLRRLMQDHDSKIAMLACKICLTSAIESEKDAAMHRLISFFPSVDFVLTDEIEQCLAFHFDDVEKVSAAAIQAGDRPPIYDPPRSRTESALRRVKVPKP